MNFLTAQQLRQFGWFCGGRVLVRFLQAAVENNHPDQIAILDAELESIRRAIAKCGERNPLACESIGLESYSTLPTRRPYSI